MNKRQSPRIALSGAFFMDVTFCELRNKEVVNMLNGRRLGRVCDIAVSCETCRILSVVVPNDKKFFRSKEDLFIPWRNVIKIGDDVILVRLLDDRMHFDECLLTAGSTEVKNGKCWVCC